LTLKAKGISQCECDVYKRTCSDCFIHGYMKPWCQNCHKDFNNGTCGCDNPKAYIKKGWKDVTPHIVKHTEKEKKAIYKKIEAHNKFLEDSVNFYDQCWQTKECNQCNKEFSARGRLDIRTCKTCLLKMLHDEDQYKEERKGVKRNF
jgi:hypothetical protein